VRIEDRVREAEVTKPTTFEKAVLDKLLAGDDPVLEQLRFQASLARLASRQDSEVGFFLTFDVPDEAPTILNPKDFHFGDVTASVDGLQFGAGFVVFVRGGRLDSLEGYSYDEPWPKTIREFELAYLREPRELKFATSPAGVREGKGPYGPAPQSR
jgi:hypothetical protein